MLPLFFRVSTFVGGIAGSNADNLGNIGTIQNCYSTGDISGKTTTNSDAYVGGIAGAVSNSADSVSYCYATGDITGESFTGNSFCGGIAGSSELTLTDHCVALVGNITKDGSTKLGRVSGFSSSTSGVYNYGRIDMQRNGGSYAWSHIGTALIDGGDVPSSDYNAQTWWGTSSPSGAGWTIHPTVAAASVSSPWIWGTNLPKLYWE